MAQDTTFTPEENRIVTALQEGTAIRFTGNGFNHSSVTADGKFADGIPRGQDGWYTQRNNGRVNQEAVEALIQRGVIRVNVVPVGGILVQENTLVLTGN